jgi:hypothetical protein
MLSYLCYLFIFVYFDLLYLFLPSCALLLIIPFLLFFLRSLSQYDLCVEATLSTISYVISPVFVGDNSFLCFLVVASDADGQPGPGHPPKQRVLHVEDVPDTERQLPRLRLLVQEVRSEIRSKHCEKGG